MEEPITDREWPIILDIPEDHCDAPTDLERIVEGDMVTFKWKSPHDNDGFELHYFTVGNETRASITFNVVDQVASGVGMGEYGYKQWAINNGLETFVLSQYFVESAANAGNTTVALVIAAIMADFPVDMRGFTAEAVPGVGIKITAPVGSGASGNFFTLGTTIASTDPMDPGGLAFSTPMTGGLDGVIAEDVTVIVFGEETQIKLTANTDYEWEVRTMCNRLTDRGSDPVGGEDFTTGDATPVCVTMNISGVTPIVTAKTARVEWTPVADVDKYFIEIQEDTEYGFPIQLETVLDHITFLTLTPNTVYKWRIRPNCATSPFSEWAGFKTGSGEGCGTPEISALADVTSIVAYWTNIANALSYAVYVNGTLVGAEMPVNILTLYGLLPDTNYDILVIANCPSGQSDIATLTVHTLKTAVPDATELALNLDGDNHVIVTWTPAAGIDGQKLYVNGTEIDVPAVTDTYDLGAFSPNAKVDVILKGFIGGKLSPGIEESIDIPAYCPIVVGLIVKTVTDKKIVLGWQAASGVIKYKVRWTVDDVTFLEAFTEDTEFTLTPAGSETLHKFDVYSICLIDGEQVESTLVHIEQLTTATPDCEEPITIAANDITPNSASISFELASNPDPFGTFKIINTADSSVMGVGTGSPIKIEGLTPGTIYNIQVANYCEGGNPKGSVAIDVETLTECVPVTALTATFSAANTQLDITWTLAAGAVNYKVQYRLAGASEWEDAPDTVANNQSVAGVLPGIYELKVTAVDADDRECPKTGISIIPQMLNLTSEQGGKYITLCWDKISAADHYLVTFVSLDETFSVPVVGTECVKIQLDPDTNYSVTVKAGYNGAYGANSAALVFNSGSLNFEEEIACIPPEFRAQMQDSHIRDNGIAEGTKLDITVLIDNYSNAFKYDIQLINKAGNVPVSTLTIAAGNPDLPSSVAFNEVPVGDYMVMVRTFLGGKFYCENCQTVYSPVCPPVTGLTSSEITDVSFKLNWDAIDGSAGYEISINDEVLETVQTNAEYLVEGLDPESEYVVKIRNICGGCFVSAVATITVNTIATEV